MATSLGLNERLFVVDPQEVHELVGTGRLPGPGELWEAEWVLGEGHGEEREVFGSGCCSVFTGKREGRPQHLYRVQGERGVTLIPDPQGLKLEFRCEGVVSAMTPQESPFSSRHRPKSPLHLACPVCPLSL